MLKQAKQLEEKMKQMQSEFATLTIEGEAGAGMVKATANGLGDIIKISIDDNAYQSGKTFVEELVAAAVNDAKQRVDEAKKNKMTEMFGAMGLPAGMMNNFPFFGQ